MRGLPKCLGKLFQCEAITCTEEMKFFTKSSDYGS